jgi:hypothetical protein
MIAIYEPGATVTTAVEFFSHRKLDGSVLVTSAFHGTLPAFSVRPVFQICDITNQKSINKYNQ